MFCHRNKCEKFEKDKKIKELEKEIKKLKDEMIKIGLKLGIFSKLTNKQNNEQN